MSLPISVLMTVYNSEKFLKESIMSVLNQTFSDFEFIIINDGSSDRSLEIIQDFEKQDKRIRVINKKNTGVTNSLNFGVFLAKGDWIARIDADDLCDINRLKIQYEETSNDRSLVLLGANCIEINDTGIKKKIHKYCLKHQDLKNNLLGLKKFFPHSSYFIRTSAIKKINGYRECIKRSQDFDLSLRLSEIGKLKCIDLPIVSIRKHKNQVSHEENGYRSFLYARIGLFSYLIKESGMEDPLDKKNLSTDYDKFEQFIDKEFKTFFLINSNKSNFLFDLLKKFQFNRDTFFILYNRDKILKKWFKYNFNSN